MRKINIIFSFFFIVVFTSCSTTQKQLMQSNNKECQSYYNFIKNNWVNDGSYIFYFKNNPVYWTEVNDDGSFKNNNQEIYFKEKCLIGLSKNEVTALFGEPTRDVKNSYLKINFSTYCMQKEGAENKSLASLRYGGVSFTFDMQDKVTHFSVKSLL